MKDAFATDKSSIPTLQELTMLKYTTSGGEKKRLSIINEASSKWRDIVCLNCDDPNRGRVLEEECGGKPHDCLRQEISNISTCKNTYLKVAMEDTDRQ